jgi:serine/threonine protein kinase
MIGKTLGNLRIISELGKGGMGVVYLAEHTKLGKRFAIKSLSPSLSHDSHFRERFYREATNQALLNHPNIVQVTDFFEDVGQFFLVMEYVDGQDLSKLIKARGQLEEKDALSILKDVLRGLEFAHRLPVDNRGSHKSMIHRDIKPSNILIDKSGIARIMDFGIAILVGEGRLTSTGAAVGSPWYMSPEQIQHPSQLDPRTDIYSLGIVLYEMLAGDVPFNGETDFRVQDQQINSPPPNLHQKNPEISEELAEIALKAMAKNPADRFQDCTEFRHAVEEYEIKRRPISPLRGKFPKTLAWGLAAIIILSAGIMTMASLRTVERPVENKITVPKDESTPLIAYNLIQTASEKASLICRDLETVKLKREGLKLEGQVESSMIDLLKKQIQDLDKNITEATAAYGDLITQLVSLKSDVVDGGFEEYTQWLTKKSSFVQIPTTRMMKHHYERYRGGERGIDANKMGKDCEQARGSA